MIALNEWTKNTINDRQHQTLELLVNIIIMYINTPSPNKRLFKFETQQTDGGNVPLKMFELRTHNLWLWYHINHRQH